MSDESPRHYLLSPLAACKARLFLLQHAVEKASTAEVSDTLKTNLMEQVEFLTTKMDLLQKRIEKTLIQK